MHMEHKTRITVAIPCYNSQETLPAVVRDVLAQFSAHPRYTYQIVLVNDGSTDGTFGVIQALCAAHSDIVGVNFTRNYGQDAAKIASLHYATGDMLIYMDDDGQHPTEGIFALAAKIEEGHDAVFARLAEPRKSPFRRAASRLNFWLLSKTIQLPRTLKISSFYALSGLMVQALRSYDSPFPYSLGYLLQVTRDIVNIDMPHRERLVGRSRYTLKKLLTLWLNGFTGFSIVPLRISTFLGFFLSFMGLVFGAFLIIRRLVFPAMAIGYASTMAVLLFMGGIIMAMLGLLGEYIGRIFMMASHKPQYTVRQTIGDAADRDRT